jgi:ABC-2 type transport system ATP-binding protein
MTLVPEDEAVYEHLTGRQFVELSARLAGVEDPKARAQSALETVELTDAADRALGGYSKGMRQRAKVASALVPEPEVLLLDEPLNGADPVQRAQLINLFKELGAAGRTVIVSSHVLREMERMADRVIAMVDGRLAAVGSVATIRAAMTDKPRQVFVDCTDPRALASELIGTPNVLGVQINGEQLMIQAADAREVAMALPALAVRRDVTVSRVEPADESLESVFRYLVEGR